MTVCVLARHSNKKTSIGARCAFALVLIAGVSGCGDLDESDPVGLDEEEVAVQQDAVTARAECIGDNDMAAGTCFKGFSLDPNSNYAWATATGSGFWSNSARITKYASNGPAAATWTFKTPVSGEVWFSVWIPSTNATARKVIYALSCGAGQQFKSIDQLYYSAQWVTLGNVGTFPAGTICYVQAAKYLTYEEINSGGSTLTKMAIDGMKMKIY